MQITITEALSELNLIKKKIDKKQGSVLSNLYRAKHVKDQLESSGGSKAFVSGEVQAIGDLTTRFLKLKGSIAEANIKNSISINGETKTIHDWLNWKRDMSALTIKFNTNVYTLVKNHFDSLQRQPQVYTTEEGKTLLVEYETNVDYGEYLKTTEKLQDTLDKLDGQLSLKNATITFEV